MGIAPTASMASSAMNNLAHQDITPVERPIIFSSPMVQAILEGAKTQTRRVVFGGRPRRPGFSREAWDETGWDVVVPEEHRIERVPWDQSKIKEQMVCPYGSPGDILWVRETWAPGYTYGGEYPCVFYRATSTGWIGSEKHPVREVAAGRYGVVDGKPDASLPLKMKWKPSIYMPRWASLITLQVTDIRVERVQDISEEEAAAEGCKAWRTRIYKDEPGSEVGQTSMQHFRLVWDQINSKRGYPWESNPWVWAVSFKVVGGK